MGSSVQQNINSNKQKVVVVTGGNGGLGKEIAQILRDLKHIVIVADINVTESLNLISADVTNESDVEKVADKVVEKFGRIDIWINNAGIWMSKVLAEDINLEKAHKLFDVNFFGYLNGMRAAIKKMKKQKYGCIVNIISTTALDGMNGSSGSIYVSSKYAIRGLTNTVREELAGSGISVLGVYPGGMKTDLFNEALPENFDEFMSVQEVAQKIVLNIESEKPEIDLVLKRPKK